MQNPELLANNVLHSSGTLSLYDLSKLLTVMIHGNGV